MTQTVTIDNVLSTSFRGFIFNATTAGGSRWRLIADKIAMPRTPVPGEVWLIGGKVRNDPRFGRQVIVDSAELTRASGRLIVKLLQGPNFPNVGEKTAQTLWERFGEELYSILDVGDVERLFEVLGPGRRAVAQASTLIDGWKRLSTEVAAYRWLDRHGFRPSLARKLVDCYGADVTSKLEANPYRLIAFESWARVDDAARSIGVRDDDPRRLAAVVESVLFDRLDLKHTWTSHRELIDRIGRKLSGDLTEKAVTAAAEAGGAVKAHDGWMAPGVAMMERFVAERCAALVGRPASRTVADDVLDRHEASSGLRLTETQRAAVRMVSEQRLSLLLGGAGVGKTATLAAIVAMARDWGRTVHQIALSGRAALRMREATNHPARTIAGWLGRIEREEMKLEGHNLVIVDEASMLDLATLYRIIRALTPSCRLLLVGDPAQLPPIGFGLTLHVLAADSSIPKVELIEVMRQAAESGIPGPARAVREGRLPAFDDFDASRGTGVSFVACDRAEIVDKVHSLLSAMGGPGQVQVIGSVKGTNDRSSGSIRAINAACHESAMRDAPVLFDRFCSGEPVIWTVNDYELDLYNGSIGTVVDRAQSDDGPALEVCFDGESKLLPAYALPDLELAYAITCHKAQGSAFPKVIIPVVESRILDRTLIYTALTRAKRQVVFVGDLQALALAIRAEPSSTRRDTGLARRQQPQPVYP